MGDNFPLCVRDQRHLLLPAWQNWLLKGNLAWFHPRCSGPEGKHNE
jgi:hypothetical protein